jgi:hypothetical protein
MCMTTTCVFVCARAHVYPEVIYILRLFTFLISIKNHVMDVEPILETERDVGKYLTLVLVQ